MNRIERTRDNAAQWDSICSRFVHQARANKQLIRVRRGKMYRNAHYDIHEGRIYRNSYDRLNVVAFAKRYDGDDVMELYYFKLEWLELAGPEPEGLEPFFGDWDYYDE